MRYLMLCALLGALQFPTVAPAQDGGGDDEQADLIEELVIHVGARDYRRRVKASWLLVLIGEPARAALVKARKGGDIEIDERVKEILAKLDDAKAGRDRPYITNKILNHLQGMDPITSLDLWGCSKVSDRGLRALRSLTELKSLRLGGGQLGDGTLTYLAGLKKLTHLELGAPKLTDAGTRHLAGLSRLSVLKIDGSPRLTDVCMTQLAQLTSLVELRLKGTPRISDAGLAKIGPLRELRRLDLLVCSRVTDAGLAHLLPLTKLERLRLVGCEEISDAGLRILDKLPALKYVSLYGCENVTPAGVAWLKQRKPACKILR